MTLDEEKRWTFTSRFMAKKGQKRFLRRLNEARNFFPELDGQTVKVGTTVNVPGKADSRSKAIYFRSRNVSFYVIGHELTHLLQGMGKVPKGERSCDVYTLARKVEFCDQAPNYVRVPKKLLGEDGFIRERYRDIVHETAKAAISMRASGKRRYISWFEKELEEVWIEVDGNQDAASEPRGINSGELLTQTRLEDFPK